MFFTIVRSLSTSKEKYQMQKGVRKLSSLYLEDFHVGDRYTTLARTVTETDVVTYAGLSADYNPLHVDAEFAAKTPFGGRVAQGRVAHGMLGASIVIGLWTRLGLVDGTALAFLETKWKFVGPILLGDTIHGEIEITHVRLASKPGKGIINVSLNAVNHRGQVVQEGELVLMVKSRT